MDPFQGIGRMLPRPSEGELVAAVTVFKRAEFASRIGHLGETGLFRQSLDAEQEKLDRHVRQCRTSRGGISRMRGAAEQ